jgi:3-methylfumaryl-CoA hydratase
VRSTDALDPGPTAALSAVLGLPAPAAAAGEALPPLWHWLHFLRWPPQNELGDDGHPRDGHFLPPLPRRTRMFAGGRLDVRAPLTLDRPAELTSSLGGVEVKEGRSGTLLFVTVRNEYRQGGEPCVTEEQDLVYRSGAARKTRTMTNKDTDRDTDTGSGAVVPSPDAPLPDVPSIDAPWQSPWRTDPALLFRFSALTANAHRIHYDEPYATGTEGYPGLVVHGPLLVLSMLELLRREAPERTVRTVSYRLRKPAFCGEPLLTCGEPGADGVRLRVAGHRAEAHATAEVTLA